MEKEDFYGRKIREIKVSDAKLFLIKLQKDGKRHSDISVTMNTYTHLGLDDARDEMIRLQELEDACKEVEKTTEKPQEAKQCMFRAV